MLVNWFTYALAVPPGTGVFLSLWVGYTTTWALLCVKKQLPYFSALMRPMISEIST